MRGVGRSVAVYGVCLALSACAPPRDGRVAGAPGEAVKEKIVEKVIHVPENTWGMEFKSTPISEAPAREQEWGKAVAHVRYAETSGATGFFVSEDGLFLTNEHVIPRVRCTRERCAGVQIVRHFAPNGAMEVFDDFEVLAQSIELDLALLRVKLPAGTKVPFLRLATELPTQKQPLVILGHPFTGALRSSDAWLKKKDDSTLNLRSVAISGNSGSPLIDKQTGLVVGLYKASNWKKSTIQRGSGAVEHVGYATDIQAIKDALKSVFPDYTGNEPNSAQFARLADGHPSLKAILPGSSDEPGKIKFEGAEPWIGQAMATDREADAWRAELDWIDSLVAPNEARNVLIDALIDVELSVGRKFSMAEDALKRLSRGFGACPNSGTCTRFKVLSGAMTREECVGTLDMGSQETWNLNYVGYNCLSGQLKSGESIIGALLKGMLKPDADYRSDQDVLSAAYWVLQVQSRLRVLSADETQGVLKVLEIVATQASSYQLAMNAEGLHALLQRDPALVGPGAFARTFD
jgi:hypothetical protein